MDKFKVYTGLEFNKLNNKRLVKLLNKKCFHNNFKYKFGLNIDIIKFNPKGECSSGGLYFIDIDNWKSWIYYGWDYIMYYICDIIIPDDALVYIENKKYKTNKFFIKNIKNIYKNENIYKCFRNLTNFKSVRQTPEMCSYIINRFPHQLEFVKNQTEKICLAAVKKNGYALQYVKKQTEKICLSAVKQQGLALKYVKKQNNKICLAAVKQNNYSMQFVKNQRNIFCYY